MVTSEGRVKITDFGISKALGQATTDSSAPPRMTIGTRAYVAPEQARAGDVGHGEDLYSVGVTAYELLVGWLPFDEAEEPMV